MTGYLIESAGKGRYGFCQCGDRMNEKREQGKDDTYGEKFKEMLLAHHPDCEAYAADTVSLGGTRLCLGCLLTYPTALIIAIALYLTNASSEVGIGLLFMVGLLFASLQLVSLTGYARKRGVKAAVKLSLGIGIGFGVYAVFSLPIHFLLRWFSFVLLAGCAGSLSLLRYGNMKKRCSGCEWAGRWARCPGFNAGSEREHTGVEEKAP